MTEKAKTKPGMPLQQRKAEGEMVSRYFRARQAEEPRLTQESLAAEIGVTQGAIGQWLKGTTPMSDKRLIQLAARLGFNPLEVRPSIALEYGPAISSTSNVSETIGKYESLPSDARRVIDALINQLHDNAAGRK